MPRSPESGPRSPEDLRPPELEPSGPVPVLTGLRCGVTELKDMGRTFSRTIRPEYRQIELHTDPRSKTAEVYDFHVYRYAAEQSFTYLTGLWQRVGTGRGVWNPGVAVARTRLWEMVDITIYNLDDHDRIFAPPLFLAPPTPA